MRDTHSNFYCTSTLNLWTLIKCFLTWKQPQIWCACCYVHLCASRNKDMGIRWASGFMCAIWKAFYMIFVYILDHSKDRYDFPSPEFYYKALWWKLCYPCMQLVFMYIYVTVEVGHRRCFISITDFFFKFLPHEYTNENSLSSSFRLN